MPNPPADTSWIKTTAISDGVHPAAEDKARTAFDRLDGQLGRWTIFAGGTAFGAMLTGLLTWIFG